MGKMAIDMDLRGLSDITKTTYLSHVKLFAKHFGKRAELMGDSEVREYLHHCIVQRKLSASYAVVCYSALKFFFETTLCRVWDGHAIPRIKRRKYLPNILSKEEIQLVFDAANTIKHRAAFMTAYAAGLRVSEVANLKIADIDSKNMQILIKQGKGNADRYSLLSETNLAVLREYYRQYHPKVWLFPGQDPTKPINPRTLTILFKDAKRKAGIKKDVTFHSLRHSFATHLLEDNVHICHIQKLLGHSSVRTTCIYLHLTRLSVLNVKSPLDTMVGPNNG